MREPRDGAARKSGRTSPFPPPEIPLRGKCQKGAPAAINTTIYSDLNFNIIRDLAPVAGILRVPAVMVVNPSVPANPSLSSSAFAKTNPIQASTDPKIKEGLADSAAFQFR